MRLPLNSDPARSSTGAPQVTSIDVVDCREAPAGHVIIRLRDDDGHIVAEAHLPALEASRLAGELTRAAAEHLRRGLAIPEPTTTQIGRA
jgi:hypothetical protein